jgi:hypothetical protein
VIPPRWVATLFGVLGVGLLPWSLWLELSLPSEKVARHWDVAWAGFDLVLAAALLLTAVSLFRQSPLRRDFAAATGTLLVADAWFDTLTAGTGSDLWFAITLAVLAELPLAGICFALARPSR